MKIKINKFEFEAKTADQAVTLATVIIKNMFQEAEQKRRIEILKKESSRVSLSLEQIEKVKKAYANKMLTGKYFPLFKLVAYHRNQGTWDKPEQWKCGQALIDLVNQL